ncbi:MAG: hypothetical protein RLZZ387_4675 [Chloroflexota bacterium]|jgi:uncharacterized protein (DUF305 family)
MRMRWLAVSGVVLVVAALVLHTVAPRMWPAAFFGRAAAATGMMGPGMMGPGMMGPGMMGPGMMGEGGMMGPGMMGTMMDGELLGDPSQPFDLRWLDSMIAHHQGGVLMTEHMVAQSGRSELRDLATRIITAQQREIAQMQAWRAAWYPDAPAPASMMPMMGAGMTAPQMRQMMGEVDLDTMFLQMMIPHHEGAIAMAEQALAQAEHPEIKELAQAIISAQRAEITEMQGYLGNP